jgi:hypothetical protein
VYFCIHDLNPNPTRAKPGLGAGFIFHPRVHPDKKNLKSERNLKKTRNLEETQKTPQKNLKPKKARKKYEKNPERNSFTKPDGHLNPTRNPTDSSSGAKFYPRVQVQVTNLI